MALLSVEVGSGLPSCGGRPPWRLFVSRVLLGLSGGDGGNVVLRSFSCRSTSYVSSIAGTMRGGHLFPAFRRAGWCSEAGWSLGVAFAGRGLAACGGRRALLP